MRDARQAVELDIVLGGIAAQDFVGALAQVVNFTEIFAKNRHGFFRRFQQSTHIGAAAHGGGVADFGQVCRQAALVDFAQPMVERVDQ